MGCYFTWVVNILGAEKLAEYCALQWFFRQRTLFTEEARWYFIRSMKHEIPRKLRKLLTVPPRESNDYKSRLEQTRLLEFLEENAGEEKAVVYADLYINIATDFLINSVWLPEADADTSNIKSLTGWNYLIRGTAWSVFHEGTKAWIEPSLVQQGNRGFERGESLVFNRELGGVREFAPYRI